MQTPGKMGVEGAGVAAMVDRGDMDGVRAYCECDCLNLFGLYVRWALLSGKLSREGHDESLRSLVNLLEVERSERPHFGSFLDSWRASKRPLPMYVAGPISEAA